MSFSGTLASINAALEGLIFQPLTDFNGEASLELITNDLGNTGAGGPKSDTDSVAITVLPVNDAPVADAGTDTIVNEGDLITRSGLFTDPDAGNTYIFLWEIRDTSDNLITATSDQTIQFTPVDDDGQPYTASFTVTDNFGSSDTATFVITVNNIIPVIDAGCDAAINEGDTFMRTGSFTDPGADNWIATVDYGDGTGVQPLTLNSDKTFNLTHSYLDDGSYMVTVSVEDDDAGVGNDSLTVTVTNVAPTANVGGPYSISEGKALALVGSGDDPSPMDAANLTFSWDLNNDGAFGDVAGSGPTVSWTELQALGLNDEGEYTISLRVFDDDTFSDATTTLTINNVAPVITSLVSSAPEVGDATPRDVVTVTGLFTYVGTLDTHTAVIDWGDGKITSALINETAGSFSGAHAYATGGIYDILVTLSDDDSGTAEEQSTALVTGARVKDGELQVVGTHGNDRVDINQVGKKLYKVYADFLPGRCHFATFDVADVESIRILLGDGNDHASIADNIDLPVLVDGGAGNDHLNAGRGPAVLIGGDGNDKLFGGRANDKIFGGNGNDVILGVGGNDLLDGGSGNDVIFGSCGDDTILGGDGNDWIFGSSGNDVLDGGNGNDRLYGGRGNDILNGGAGNDTLFGDSGNDTLLGGDGNDQLYGGCGNDLLDGGDGNDRLFGGSKNDILIVGEGHEKLKGGCGNNILINPSPSWVRQFVLDLAADGLNPNSDIRVMIADLPNEQLIGGADRRKFSV